jgi:VanZ family protein
VKLDAKVYPVIFWIITITILSLMPSSSIPDNTWGSQFQIDKLVHIVLYSIYTWLLGRYLCNKWTKSNILLGLAFGITVVYGIFMELLQYYLSPSRFFEMLDIIANIIGSIVGLIFLKIKI